MDIDWIVKEEVLKLNKTDYIFCLDCNMIVDLWKYHSIEETGHAKCNWRYVTEEELGQCVADCSEYIPYCPKCASIVMYELQHKLPCSCCGLDNHVVVWRNCFGEIEKRGTIND